MKTATMRQLRNETNTLLKWVEAGETVIVTKRSKPVLRLLPVVAEPETEVQVPDFKKRMSRIFPVGDNAFNVTELLREERDRY